MQEEDILTKDLYCKKGKQNTGEGVNEFERRHVYLMSECILSSSNTDLALMSCRKSSF